MCGGCSGCDLIPRLKSFNSATESIRSLLKDPSTGGENIQHPISLKIKNTEKAKSSVSLLYNPDNKKHDIKWNYKHPFFNGIVNLSTTFSKSGKLDLTMNAEKRFNHLDVNTDVLLFVNGAKIVKPQKPEDSNLKLDNLGFRLTNTYSENTKIDLEVKADILNKQACSKLSLVHLPTPDHTAGIMLSMNSKNPVPTCDIYTAVHPYNLNFLVKSYDLVNFNKMDLMAMMENTNKTTVAGLKFTMNREKSCSTPAILQFSLQHKNKTSSITSRLNTLGHAESIFALKADKKTAINVGIHFEHEALKEEKSQSFVPKFSLGIAYDL
ncbi:MAG: hypothetical protein MHPSP_000756 [Paramarteilia canceri]